MQVLSDPGDHEITAHPGERFLVVLRAMQGSEYVWQEEDLHSQIEIVSDSLRDGVEPFKEIKEAGEYLDKGKAPKHPLSAEQRLQGAEEAELRLYRVSGDAAEERVKIKMVLRDPEEEIEQFNLQIEIRFKD